MMKLFIGASKDKHKLDKESILMLGVYHTQQHRESIHLVNNWHHIPLQHTHMCMPNQSLVILA